MTPPLPLLVLVTGSPGAGKTTLAYRLGEALLLPVLWRDLLKALLYDGFGAPEAIPEPAVSRAYFSVFYGLLREFVRTGSGIIAESAMDPAFAVDQMQPLLWRTHTVLVHCTTAPGVNAARFIARAATGERHPSHPDARYIADLDQGGELWAVYDEPVPLGVPTLRVDTTDGYAPDFEAIVAFIQSRGLGTDPTLSA